MSQLENDGIRRMIPTLGKKTSTLNKYSAGIYLLKVNNRNTRTKCEVCLKLTTKIPERHHWCRSGIFVVNFEPMASFCYLYF